MQIAHGDRRLQELCKRDRVGFRLTHHDTAAAENHRKLRVRQQIGGRGEARVAPGAALDRDGRRDLALDIAIEEVARDVELRGAELQQRAVECAARELLAIRVRLFTCAWYLVVSEKIGSCSVSWKPPRPMVPLPVSGVTTTTGECAQNAAAVDVRSW